jgi:hypothetical protein
MGLQSVGIMLVGTVPLWVAAAFLCRRPLRPALIIAFLCVGAMTAKVGCVLSQATPPGWNYLAAVMTSPTAVSYYGDAVRLPLELPDYLANYDLAVRSASLHTATKPAGPLLYFRAFVLAFGDSQSTAIVAGLALMALSLTAVPATFLAVRVLTSSTDAGVLAAAILASSPGFLLFPVKFDAVWVTLTCLMLAAWHRAQRQDWLLPCLGLGATIGLACFVAFHLLVVGLFLVLMPFAVGPPRRLAEQVDDLTIRGITVMLVVVGLHLGLYLAIGYSTPAVAAANLDVQRTLLQSMPERRMPHTAVWDLYDFSLGLGWSFPILLGLALGNRAVDPGVRRLGWLAAAQLIVVAAFAMIPGETARCWMFLAPVALLAPVAELTMWSPRAQGMVVALVVVATLVVHAQMVFVLP